MPIQVEGFAQALSRCLDFQSVAPEALEAVLAEVTQPLEMRFAEPSVDVPLIRSGSAFSRTWSLSSMAS